MAPLQLTIKTLQQKHFKLDVDSEDTILSVKEKIQESQGHAIATQKLIFSGKILADDKKVDDYKISEKDFLVVMVSKPKVTPAASSSAAATPKESTPVVKAAEPAAATVPESAAAVPAAATIETAAAAAAAAEPAPASTTNEDSGSQLVTGTQLDSVIQNMMEMGFERDQCVRALRASFNNPDRAVEYLFNGIPQNILDEMNANQQAQQAAASQQQAEAGTAPATAAAQPTSPSATTETNPNAPLNLFAAAQQQAQQAAQQQQQQQSAGANPDFANLRNTAHFQQIRQLVQSNPALLQPLLQQLGQSNPELLRSINADPNGFLQALLEGVDDEGLEGGQGGQVPPGSQMVQVTQEEKEAIDRLVALGFDRHIVIEAYFACEKNEELAANYLFEHGNEEYED